MQYEVIIRDLDLEDTFEFTIKNIKGLIAILECFKDKKIELDVRRTDIKTLRRIK